MGKKEREKNGRSGNGLKKEKRMEIEKVVVAGKKGREKQGCW